MNERILELALQAGCHSAVLLNMYGKYEALCDSEIHDLKHLQKFAELIVRECAEVCYDHSNAAGGIDTHFGYGYKDCGNDIKRNFGVEE